jgi:hypothetical protein
VAQLLDDDVGKVEEIEGDLVDLKAFVIEGMRVLSAVRARSC